MPKERRTLLDEKRDSRSFLPRTATFRSAFPTVKSLRIEATPYGDGLRYRPNGQPDFDVFTESTLQPAIVCRNPRCQQGGTDIENLLHMLTYARTTDDERVVHCCGHEGSPKGRRHGDSCGNYVVLKIRIEYQDPQQP
jgi:hypothetical protein